MKPYIRTLAICLLTFVAIGNTRAEELTVSDMSVATFGQAYATVSLENTDEYSSLSFVIQLPTGFSFADIAGYDPFSSLGPDVHTTDRSAGHSIDIGYIDENIYSVIISSEENDIFTGHEGPIARLGLWASDELLNGNHEIFISDIRLIRPDGSEVTLPEVSFTCETKVYATLGSTGYASFSWPTAIDFSESGINAYIAYVVEDGFMKLEQVTKVPAHTGVVLQGAAGTYSLQTLSDDEECDDVSGNLLLPNDMGNTLVTYDGYFALTQRSYVGFFRVEEGVFIPRHKCYYIDNSGWGGNSFCFDNSDGIRQQEVSPSAAGAVYTLSGIQVSHPQKKGIYIINGKKIIYQ